MEEKTPMIARFCRQLQAAGLACLLALVLPALPGGVSQAMAQAPGGPAAMPQPTSERAERLRRTLAADGALDAAARSEAEAQLERAASAEEETSALLAETAELRRAMHDGESAAGRIESQLASDSSATLARFQRELERIRDDAALERLLETERSALANLQAELGRSGTELAAISARPLGLASDLSSQRQRVGELRAALEADTSGDDSSVALRARRLASEAALRRALARLDRLQAEQESLPARRRVAELRERLLQRQSAEQVLRVDLVQARVQEARGAGLSSLIERLREALEGQSGAPAALQDLARENLAIGEELLRASALTESLDRRSRDSLHTTRDAEAALRATRARLEFAGARDGLGLMLTDLRRRLESPARLQRQLEDVRQRLTTLRLALIELGERRRNLDQREAEVERRLAQLDPDSEEEAASLREGLDQLLQTRAELLPPLERAKLDEVEALDALQAALQAQLQVTTELTALLDRHLLWTPSHEPVSLAWLVRLPEGIADLAKTSRYQTSARLAWREIEERPFAVLGWLVLVGAAFGLRSRAPAMLTDLAQPLRRVRGDSYRHTARALLVTLLAALPWVLLLWGMSWLLREAGEVGRFSDSLGRALYALAGGVLLAEAMNWLSLERGLGHAHFRWPRARREAMRWALPWIVCVLLPLQLVLALSFVRGQEPALDTAARLALIAFCGVAAWLSWRLLAPGAVWTSRSREVTEPLLLRRLTRAFLVAMLTACALLALAGYLMTAGVLLRAIWASLGVVLLVALAQGLIARWFLLGERRLIAKRLEERSQAEPAQGESGSDEHLPDIEPEEIALANINAQTRRLLRAMVLSLLVVGLFSVWSDVLPAFERLKEIGLWQFSTIDADGQPMKGTVSLRDLLLGVLALLLTFVAARNLPALVEIALLSRINLDAPTRYAITSVSRYVIVIAGGVTGLSMLGLHWSQLQWMAAALTVGLGFGLQEIFANFVSGLILLFERPFRVGDVITIGDQTGTVSRIRTRATTLVDFDGREIVVPNKTFITDRLINWTLSDARTRVIVKVGVAYGTSPPRVHALLAQAAEEHPQVLKDPAPRTWFMAFGASSLDFELRVFVESIQDRMRVMNDLNGRIAELFAEAGIEIAFPQLDLHVRDLPRALEAQAPSQATQT